MNYSTLLRDKSPEQRQAIYDNWNERLTRLRRKYWRDGMYQSIHAELLCGRFGYKDDFGLEC